MHQSTRRQEKKSDEMTTKNDVKMLKSCERKELVEKGYTLWLLQ